MSAGQKSFHTEMLKSGRKEDDILFASLLEVVELFFFNKLCPTVLPEQPVLVVGHLNVLSKGNIILASVRLMLR